MSIDFQNIYHEFKKYPLKEKIEGCPHCELENAETSLHSKALGLLSWDDLQIFVFKSMTTFGDVEDFKHFLPRIFELYISDYWNAPYDFGLFLSKLEYAKIETWVPQEKNAVINLYENWVNQLKSAGTETDLEILEDIETDIECFKVQFVV
ncbi:hypothetical protein E2K93_11900 [Thalassotalea sp. HSM 43]|uniref:hypothetical protein n=1 Tax=Thalassotalea sp. HSM 43 TaxID=2552945 RepID=UPI00107FF564|nr:hypothetical protein [Thalassotalea sp. HSM 43]QBY05045.1 hypothetical protein E2K93_11900 [Thalassotalea sp. HSM 43]